MDVVATAKGFYGSQLRERGELFTLKNGKTDFSGRWMVKAGTADAKQLLRESAADGKALSAAQIAMEEAEATGRAGAHKAEMAAMQAQIAKLTAALTGGADAEPEQGEPEQDEPEQGEPEQGEPEQDEETAPTARKTRRTRR